MVVRKQRRPYECLALGIMHIQEPWRILVLGSVSGDAALVACDSSAHWLLELATNLRIPEVSRKHSARGYTVQHNCRDYHGVGFSITDSDQSIRAWVFTSNHCDSRLSSIKSRPLVLRSKFQVLAMWRLRSRLVTPLNPADRSMSQQHGLGPLTSAV